MFMFPYWEILESKNGTISKTIAIQFQLTINGETGNSWHFQLTSSRKKTKRDISFVTQY